MQHVTESLVAFMGTRPSAFGYDHFLLSHAGCSRPRMETTCFILDEEPPKGSRCMMLSCKYDLSCNNYVYI